MKIDAKRGGKHLPHLHQLLSSLEVNELRYQKLADHRQARMKRKHLLNLKRTTLLFPNTDTQNPSLENQTQFREQRCRRRQILNLRRSISSNHNSNPSTRNIYGSSSTSAPNRMCRQIDLITEAWNFGRPTCVCEHCGALLWYEERTEKSKKPNHPKFSICCMEGRVQLPLLKPPPPLRRDLLDYCGNTINKSFRRNI